ncbi:hypothetical protein CAPI_01335 [Corynebacterium capitovis DSM 44611]|uniref:hypothetical protein n=1 Tax=Corynebacterium capitovis TaxID=131081 RepID=UPI000363CE01|nr:hypothetical protein [Corynebacterium capitovis]WKD56841.1 hypothetical protein CAPI_01335 [Corynebacterium capitovis DSM 44611]
MSTHLPSAAPGAEPRANPPARYLAVSIGLVFLAVAAVAARDLWYRFAAKHPSDSWVGAALSWLAAGDVSPAVVAAGVVLSLAGLWLIVSAFRPRGRTHVRVNSDASMWMRPVDIARKATYVTRADIGANKISSRADRRTLTVQLEDDASGAGLASRVEERLNREFTHLARPPRTRVIVTAAPTTTEERPR